MTEKVRLNANVPVELKEWLKEYAAKENMTQTEVIIQSLYYLKRGEELDLSTMQMKKIVDAFGEIIPVDDDYFIFEGEWENEKS